MSESKQQEQSRRRRLGPSEKYEICVSVLTEQATQREAAERFKVDRSTVVHVCRVAKQGVRAGRARVPSSSRCRTRRPRSNGYGPR